MTQALANSNTSELMEKVMIGGDLKSLSPDQRVEYYRRVCESVGLNPLTKPFEYLELDGKLILYARRDCTDQLRKINSVSIPKLDKERMDDMYIVTAYATTPDGRTDTAVGVVSLLREDVEWRWNEQTRRNEKKSLGTFSELTGDFMANAIMKCETKAKRRVTLSICGLGITDESELETIPSATPTSTVVEMRNAPANGAGSRNNNAHRAAPPPNPSPTRERRPLTKEEIRAGYQALVEEAAVLELELDPETYGVGEEDDAAAITKKGQLLRKAITEYREPHQAPEPPQHDEAPTRNDEEPF